jgi:hypothetical protein
MLVLGRPLVCPTGIYSDCDFDAGLKQLVTGRRWALATSEGWRTRVAVDALCNGDNPPLAVISELPANPRLSDVHARYPQLPQVGIACSFASAEVAAYNSAENPERIALIAKAFGCELAKLPMDLAACQENLGLGHELNRYVQPKIPDSLGDNLITPVRAANNLCSIDGARARVLARNSLERFAVRAA